MLILLEIEMVSLGQIVPEMHIPPVRGHHDTPETPEDDTWQDRQKASGYRKSCFCHMYLNKLNK